ncbi:hypothetical protein [Ruegeria sp. SCP11]|uniref:hypothetical protein n=1 Tax=Ruegeria sp. SCP11 TaxID=3141378 RepID=UPI003339B0B1
MNIRTLPLILHWQYWTVSNIRTFFLRFVSKTVCAMGFLCVLSGSLQAEDLTGTEDLVNTIWVTKSGYSYVSVTTDGTIESFEGANFAIEFLETKHGVLVARVRWISPEEQLSETQYVLFVPDGVGGLSFQAAGAPDVVGGAANGTMRTVGDDAALFTSFNLEKGRAGSINTTLTKVDTLPAKFEAKK